MVAAGVFGLCAALWAQAAPAGAGELTVRNEEPPFETKLPRGYEASKDPRMGRSYERSAGTAEWERLWIRLYAGEPPTPQGQARPDEALARPALIPADARLRAVKEQWGEHEIEAVEARFVHETMPFYARVAHVPLLPRFSVLAVFAPEPLEEQARTDLKAALRNLKGKAAWKTRAEKEVEQRLWWGLRITIGMAAAYPLAWLLFFRGNFMRAHFLRTLWLALVGFACLALVVMGGQLAYMMGALLFLSLAGRRLKLAIDEG